MLKYIISSIIAFVALNAQEANIGQNTQESMQSLEDMILLPPLTLDDIEDDDTDSHHDHNHDNLTQYGFSGHIGVFNKTNLGKTKDNYNAFSASLGLTYSFFYVDSVPTETHDASVDIIITEKGEAFIGEKNRY